MSIPPILIQQGYTNLITNPVGAGASTTGWGTSNSTLTAIDIDGHDTVSTGFQISATGTANAQMIHINAYDEIAQGTPYVIFADVRGSGSTIGKSARVQMIEGGGASPATFFARTDAVLTADWQTIVATGTISQADRTSASAYVMILSPAASDVIEVTRIQVTQSEEVLPFVVGTRAERRSSGFIVPGKRISPLTPH